MRTFAEEAKTTRQTSSAKSSQPGRARLRPGLDKQNTLPFLRPIGNQGVPGLPRTEPGKFDDGAAAAGTTQFGHDFSQTPIHARARPAVRQNGNSAASDVYAPGGPTSRVRVDQFMRGPGFGEPNRPPPDAKWRLPPSADLQTMLSVGTVDEAVVRSRVRRLLERMDREGRLRVAASVDIGIVMDEIFPAPGILDQAAYERYIDPADRTMVYYSVRDASTAPQAADRADLRTAMVSAATTAQTVATDEAGLRAVFGPTQWTTARDNYGLIHDRLRAVSTDIQNRVTTDYNLDAQETFLGGWASFNGQHMHLLSEVVADPLTAESKATLVHEGAHLAASSIDDDHGYYGTTGFEAKDHAEKVDNAAHYEELPRRVWGVSSYAGVTFTPGVSSSGAPLTTEQRIREGGASYYQLAWDAAADFDDLIKEARRDQLDGRALDAGTVARLLEVSPLMDLTLHEQPRSPPEITRLDVTTSESVVRAMGMAGDRVESLANVMPIGPFSSPADEIAAGVDLAVDAAMAAYGGLLGDATRDRRLVDWLHSHYKNVYP